MKKHQFFDIAIDPIEELIGMQLASLSLEGIYTLKRSGNQVSQSFISKSFTTNSIEDMFIEALDKKYHRTSRSKDIIVSLLVSGLTVRDISMLMSVSPRTIRRISTANKGEVRNGKD